MPHQFDSYLAALGTRLRAPLPGVAAQREMAPIGRLDDGYDPCPHGARRAAVLALLWPHSPHEVALPLIARPEDGTVHAGQLALPGGRHEKGDSFPVGTALRETVEELGLPGPEQRDGAGRTAAVAHAGPDAGLRIAGEPLRVLGTLTPLYIPVSETIVVPVVAALSAAPPLTPSPTEVTAVHIVELQGLPQTRSVDTFRTQLGSTVAPCYHLDGGVIWGATAMILSELCWLHRDTARVRRPGSSRAR